MLPNPQKLLPGLRFYWGITKKVCVHIQDEARQRKTTEQEIGYDMGEEQSSGSELDNCIRQQITEEMCRRLVLKNGARMIVRGTTE